METLIDPAKREAILSYIEKNPISKEQRRRDAYEIEKDHIFEKLDRGFEMRGGKKRALTKRTRRSITARSHQLQSLLNK